MSFPKHPGLSVIVPVYNEKYLVLASFKRLELLAASGLFNRVRVIVVDDGSSDGTSAVLREHQSSLQAAKGSALEWVFRFHEKNRGKGHAIQTALEHVNTDLVVIHDADLEYHPRDLLQMIPLFQEENADAVFGSRFMPGGFKRALFFRHTLGNKLITLLCNLVTDLNLTDIETCYKMVKADLLKSIPLESNRFGIEPEMTIKLAKRKARIFEVPITYSGRTYIEGKKIGWKDGVQALWAMLKFAISDRIYSADAYGSEILARLQRAPKFTRWMADTIKPYVGNRVLEIGAGIGNLTLNLVPRVEYWATDVQPHYLERLEKLRLDRPYLRVCFTDGTVEESFPAGQQFDTVICLNVVEHLENDVAALRNIRESLGVNGRAVILVPQGKALYGTLDKVLGHYRRYTRGELAQVAQQAGLEIEEIFGFNRFGSPGWLLNARVLKRETFGFWQIQLLNFLVPLVRRIDRWLPFPPLSLIAILRVPPKRHTVQTEIPLDFPETQVKARSKSVGA
jgi:glycosyltransferase involved in cell wall biosynthesis